ncbi:hypothetical protein Ato02nite_039520 [Paractinoplanes toevensis]|uniref:Uncharacterized protein n=1 Tax=Paractinoplanes toevensis TaxID=571911 RepID=A0A919TDG6_9ACTN|nr:hypothetical protein Ato02nite_039520 [Actinoplanes toevensis]
MVNGALYRYFRGTDDPAAVSRSTEDSAAWADVYAGLPAGTYPHIAACAGRSDGHVRVGLRRCAGVFP